MQERLQLALRHFRERDVVGDLRHLLVEVRVSTIPLGG
jgi:hypothetical protein